MGAIHFDCLKHLFSNFQACFSFHARTPFQPQSLSLCEGIIFWRFGGLYFDMQ